jgi:hypothetical protein
MELGDGPVSEVNFPQIEFDERVFGLSQSNIQQRRLAEPSYPLNHHEFFIFNRFEELAQLVLSIVKVFLSLFWFRIEQHGSTP